MTVEQLLANPFVLLAIGFVIAEWRRSRDTQASAVQVDATVIARLQTIETWQRDHNSIHGCVQSLRATTESMAKTVDRLSNQFERWIATHAPMAYAPTPTRPMRSPYDFQEAREWALDK